MRQIQEIRIALAVTAAGRAARFGSDKLAASYRGQPIGEICLSLYPPEDFSDRVAVFSSAREQLKKYAEAHGYRARINPCPEAGLSSSVWIAVSAILEKETPDGILFAAADMPFLTPASIKKLRQLFTARPEYICALSHKGTIGKPVIFPKALYPELLALDGDKGGRGILKKHPELIKTVEAEEKELVDIDTPEEAARWLSC